VHARLRPEQALEMRRRAHPQAVPDVQHAPGRAGRNGQRQPQHDRNRPCAHCAG
jgi:hypothetical protein